MVSGPIAQSMRVLTFSILSRRSVHIPEMAAMMAVSSGLTEGGCVGVMVEATMGVTIRGGLVGRGGKLGACGVLSSGDWVCAQVTQV